MRVKGESLMPKNETDYDLDITNYELQQKTKFPVLLNGFVPGIQRDIFEDVLDERFVDDYNKYISSNCTGTIYCMDDGTLLFMQKDSGTIGVNREKLEHYAETCYVLDKSIDELRAIYLLYGYDECVPHNLIAEHNPKRSCKEQLKEVLYNKFEGKRYSETQERITEEDIEEILSDYDQNAPWADIEKDGWRLYKPFDGRNSYENVYDIDFKEFGIKRYCYESPKDNSIVWEPKKPLGEYVPSRIHVLSDTDVLKERPNFISHKSEFRGILLQYDELPAVYLEGNYEFLEKYHGFGGKTCTVQDVIDLLSNAEVVDTDNLSSINHITQQAVSEKASHIRFAGIKDVELLKDENLPEKFVEEICDRFIYPSCYKFTQQEKEMLRQIEETEGLRRAMAIEWELREEHKQKYEKFIEPILRQFCPNRHDLLNKTQDCGNNL